MASEFQLAEVGGDSISPKCGSGEHRSVSDADICWEGTVRGVCRGGANLLAVPVERSGCSGFGDVGAELDGDADPGGSHRGERVVAAVDG